MSILT